MSLLDNNLYRGTLERSVVFAGLSPEALERVIRNGKLLEARKGDHVFFEKMPGGFGLYVILEGKLDIFQTSGGEAPALGATRMHLNILGAGQTIGEYSLIDRQSTSAAAQALEDTRLFFLPGAKFEELVEADPAIASVIYRNLLQYLIQRLRRKDAEMMHAKT